MSSLRGIVLVALCVGCASAKVDLGKIDLHNPPRAADLKVPESDKDVETVGLYANVVGELEEKKVTTCYVLVNPRSNPDTQNLWWVQRLVSTNGSGFTCRCQFGEGDQGRGEYFAVLAILSDKTYTEGQQLERIPKAIAYSRVKFVKRVR